MKDLILNSSLFLSATFPSKGGKDLREYCSVLREVPLVFNGEQNYPDEVREYFRFYDLPVDKCTHYFGSFDSNGEKLTAHIFVPPKAERTVYLVHGYLLHSAGYADLYRKLLDWGFAVAVFDLPGHGISGGKEAHIGKFYDYVLHLENFIKATEKYLPPKYALLGISTGSSIIMEYFRTGGTIFEKHILAAPLVRSHTWDLSLFGISLFNWLPGVKTTRRKNISDPEAAAFMVKDPLKRRFIPMSWLKALTRWNRDISSYHWSKDVDMLVIQGEQDIALEWEYNLAFIAGHFPEADLQTLPQARHELFFEVPDIQEEIYVLMKKYLLSHSVCCTVPQRDEQSFFTTDLKENHG